MSLRCSASSRSSHLNHPHPPRRVHSKRRSEAFSGRPIYALGEKWIRHDGVFDLIRVEKGGYVFAADGGREIHLTRDLVISRMSRRGEVEWELHPAPRMTWPLTVGKWGVQEVLVTAPTWPRVMMARHSEMTSAPARFTWEVTEFGQIQTPAGKFDAFKITQSLGLRLSSSLLAPMGSVAVWYAPEVRQVIKAEGPVVAFDLVGVERPATVAAAAGKPSGPTPSGRTGQGPGAPTGEKPATPLPSAAAGGAGPAATSAASPNPVTIVFTYPQNEARLKDEASVVAALVSSARGVSKIVVELNGTEVHRQIEREPAKSLMLASPVKLREGANSIVVTAEDSGGAVSRETRTVVFEVSQVAAVPPAAPSIRPPPRNLWAVVVGVGRYEDPAIPRLRYTVPDAEAISQTLVNVAGLKHEHVMLLTDKTERKPTLRNIRWALGTFLSRSASKDDTVLIFFAGHGAPEIDPRGIERDGFAKYLIPSDADADDLYSSALPMDELETIFSRIEAERIVAFLDTCYSGAAGGRTFGSRKTRAGQVDDEFIERLARSKGRAIITASRSTEVSLELPELGHGVFTHYLIEGLRGAGDGNKDGIVTLQELYEYVEAQVSRRSRAAGGNQHPMMRGQLEGSLPLVRVKR